jgi:two-component system LytT family response regulator
VNPSQRIHVLIVDDERPARERVRRLLVRDPRVEIAGCCAGGAEALAQIEAADAAAHQVQLMFLDVQMPEVGGFDVVSRLIERIGEHDGPTTQPAVVFVTAYDEYALRAFDAHAIDYLLKPFSDERFQAALDRAIHHIRAGHAHTVVSKMQALLGGTASPDSAGPTSARRRAVDRIVVKGAGRVRLLPVDQIAWIEAEGMYVTIHTRDAATHLHRALLGSLESSLDARRFVRIHRSSIVNIDVVSELRQDAHGDYIAVLRDGTEVRVGRRFLTRLRTRLGQPF